MNICYECRARPGMLVRVEKRTVSAGWLIGVRADGRKELVAVAEG